MANQDDVFNLRADTIFVGIGTSGAVGITCGAGVNSQIFKHVAGGTLYITGTTTKLLSGATMGYLMGYGEAVNIGGPASYFVTSFGATSMTCLIKTLTAGN